MCHLRLYTIALDRIKSLPDNSYFTLPKLLAGDPEWDNIKNHSGLGKRFYSRARQGEFDGPGYIVRPSTRKNPQMYQKLTASAAVPP